MLGPLNKESRPLDVSVLQHLANAAQSEPDGSLPNFVDGVSGIPLISQIMPSTGSTGTLSARTFGGLIAGIYGANADTVRGQLRRLHTACSRFLELYGDGPVWVLRAPARINILGEHVDYVSYLHTVSLPFASREYDMLMLYRPSAEKQVRGASTLAKYEPFSFGLSEGPLGDDGGRSQCDWRAYLQSEPPPHPHWANYVKGAVYFAQLKYGGRVTRGIDFLVDSRIPPSGGASSSSALVVLSGAATRAANSIPCALYELALDSSEAEWYVGTRGGAMDHLTICLAKYRRGVFISYRDRQARPVPLNRSDDHRWVTFFSHGADKGKEVMLEYNERAAVSRLLIPAIVETWKETDADRYASWVRALEAVTSGTVERLNEIESLVQALPETLTIAEVGSLFPDTYHDLALSFPALVGEGGEYPLCVRGLAAHHTSEVRRVYAALEIFTRMAAGGFDNDGFEFEHEMRSLGALLNESHQSLRDNYRVSTDDVELLVGLLRSQKGVYGARLMGGGFGGNVLALTSKEDVDAIIDKVQLEYYGPEGRNGVREGSVMISTTGDGLSQVNVETPWRQVIEEFNSLGRAALDYRGQVESLLDCLPAEIAVGEVQPVIVAAGKGSRALATGLDQPKPLANVSGVPAILRILRSVRAALPGGRTPVVIVSPGNEATMRQALANEEVLFVTQPEALGTGDAVLRAADHIQGATRTLVIWGTQPVIRLETITRTLKLAALFDGFDMVLPTAMMENPYAPLSRGELGQVAQSRETHLEQAVAPPFGETNLGLFLLQSKALLQALSELHSTHWLESDQRYDRPAGELGFPNEMINFLAGREGGVLACPFADWREAQGIKSREDVHRCERFISELQE